MKRRSLRPSFGVAAAVVPPDELDEHALAVREPWPRLTRLTAPAAPLPTGWHCSRSLRPHMCTAPSEDATSPAWPEPHARAATPPLPHASSTAALGVGISAAALAGGGRRAAPAAA